MFQLLVNNYVEVPDMTADGKPLLLGPGQDFMACIIGAAMCGVGLGIVFNYNGSTGGTRKNDYDLRCIHHQFLLLYIP